MSGGFLLDTSVMSMFSPGRTDATPRLLGWADLHNDQLHLSTISVFEIAQGIAKLRRAGGHERAGRYSAWLDDAITGFGDRLLAFEESAARVAGDMADASIATGSHPGPADVLIAATAKANDLVLITRNVRHFAPLKIEVFDPFVQLPD